MRSFLGNFLVGFDWFVLVYFFALNSSYLILIVVAARTFAQKIRRPEASSDEEMFANPLTPGISVIVPAYNEEVGIVQSTRAVMSLLYPDYEVVVVDDGSKDETFERLREEFDLIEVAPSTANDIRVIGRTKSLHVPRNGDALTVVRKENAGRRSDALNAGINASRHPLVCCIDADSILEPNALLKVARPFVDDPDRMIATGGVIRAINGSAVTRGAVTKIRQPKMWIERIQIIEYLRSFLMGRTGWSKLRALLIISGAFGLYRRDLVVEVGGFDPDSLGEDADLLVGLHRLMCDRQQPYEVAFVPDPVCWTEVPSTLSVLRRQRRRWSQGLGEVMWKYRGMFFRRRYGRVGMIALPYYLVFEFISPIIELVGLFAVAVAVAAGVVNVGFALLFLLVAMLFGVALSVGALLIEEATYHRYERWRDVGVGVLASFVENFVYRQMHSWWRLEGIIAWARGKENEWGEMTRTGFAVDDGT